MRFMRVLFQNDRYVTEGIKDKLYPLHQLLLWNFIDEMDVEQKYYFQSFNITGGVQVVEIEHIQDTPPYRAVHRLKTGILIENIKVYVIDDEERTTMLLSNEY